MPKTIHPDYIPIRYAYVENNNNETLYFRKSQESKDAMIARCRDAYYETLERNIKAICERNLKAPSVGLIIDGYHALLWRESRSLYIEDKIYDSLVVACLLTDKILKNLYSANLSKLKERYVTSINDETSYYHSLYALKDSEVLNNKDTVESFEVIRKIRNRYYHLEAGVYDELSDCEEVLKLLAQIIRDIYSCNMRNCKLNWGTYRMNKVTCRRKTIKDVLGLDHEKPSDMYVFVENNYGYDAYLTANEKKKDKMRMRCDKEVRANVIKYVDNKAVLNITAPSIDVVYNKTLARFWAAARKTYVEQRFFTSILVAGTTAELVCKDIAWYNGTPYNLLNIGNDDKNRLLQLKQNELIDELYKHNAFDGRVHNKLQAIRRIRNRYVHDIEISPSLLDDNKRILNDLCEVIKTLYGIKDDYSGLKKAGSYLMDMQTLLPVDEDKSKTIKSL